MAKCRVLIVLWTTGRCNLKCRYCYASESNEKYDMDFETATKVLDYFGNQPMKIQFAGGEPLLNYDLICKVYEYVNKRGYDAVFQMQTNATLIDEQKAIQIKKMKIAVGVSLDGPPHINEWLRGKTKEAVYGIQCLAKAGVKTNINSVVTEQNVTRLTELVDFALYLGNIRGIGLDLLREAGRAKNSDNLIKKANDEQLKSALNLLHERCELLHKQTGKKIVIREIEEAKKRLSSSACNKNYCYASCGSSYVILPNGDVYPCGSLINKSEYYMGNINNIPLKYIELTKQTPGECSECDYFYICPGGCPSRMIVNGVEQDEETLDCVLKKSAFDIALKMCK